MIIERVKGEQPSNERKIMQLCKTVGAQRTATTLKELRSNTNAMKTRDFPSKSFIRSILESYPNYFGWKVAFGPSSMKESLQAAVLDSKVNIAPGLHDANNRYLENSLNLIHYELVHENYQDAFALLHALEEDVDNNAILGDFTLKHLISSYQELRGLEVQLRSFAHSEDALSIYRQAAEANPNNLSVCLKVASVLLDLGRLDDAKQEFDKLLVQWNESKATTNEEPVIVNAPGSGASLTGDEEGDEVFSDARAGSPSCSSVDASTDIALIRAYRAWILIHRASYFIARDSLGNYQPNAVENGLKDLDEAARLTGKSLSLSLWHFYLQCLFPACYGSLFYGESRWTVIGVSALQYQNHNRLNKRWGYAL